MNEAKAKDLRNFIKHMVRGVGDKDAQFVTSILTKYSEREIHRAMRVLGLETSGEDVLRSAVYAANITQHLKRKRENVAYSIALSQMHGIAKVPKELWRRDELGERVYGRERLKEIVKEAMHGDTI